jgi:hypothetical protein
MPVTTWRTVLGKGLQGFMDHYGSPQLAACGVIPANAGIQKPDWMRPDQVRDRLIKSGMTQNTPASCGGVVY